MRFLILGQGYCMTPNESPSHANQPLLLTVLGDLQEGNVTLLADASTLTAADKQVGHAGSGMLGPAASCADEGLMPVARMHASSTRVADPCSTVQYCWSAPPEAAYQPGTPVCMACLHLLHQVDMHIMGLVALLWTCCGPACAASLY